MSISPTLRAASRAAYRDVLRAASVTFSGKSRVKYKRIVAHNAVAGDATVFQGHILHSAAGSLSSYLSTAFRAKIRSDMSKGKVKTDESLQKQTQFVQDVANVLRKNVVQGILVKSPEESGGDGIYRMRTLP